MVQGACQGVCQLFWIRLRIFDTALVLLWVLQGGSSLANLPAAPRQWRKGESKHASLFSLSTSWITDTDILATPPLLGLWRLWNPQCNKVPSPHPPLVPERGSDQECLLDRQTLIEAFQFKQSGDGRDTAGEINFFQPSSLLNYASS